MKKLRSKKVFKVPTSFICSNDYSFDMSIERARNFEYLISIANNQCFKAIERITDRGSNDKLVDELYKKIREEKKKQRPDKRAIKEIRKQIDEYVLLKEIINVYVDDKKAYRHIVKHGFMCNGIKYVRLLCGAGMGRRSTVSFCDERIYGKLDEILRNGIEIEEINIAKYNAYYGLYMSGMYDVRTPRFIVIPDCEIPITGNKVDYIVDDKKINAFGEEVDYRRIEERDFVFEANVFDGSGLISPSMAYKWACDLEADYVPSNFIIRSSFVKGMVCVFDFHQFAEVFAQKDENGKYMIEDLYGDKHDLNDVDVILTKSQFKMSKYYKNLEQYKSFCEKNGHVWGVTKLPKKFDQEYSLINYQYIQTLDLDDDDIERLISYTTNWLISVCSGDELYTKLFTYGIASKDETINSMLDKTDLAWVKGLCLDYELFKDDYIKRKIYQSIQKKIDEAKIGRLWVRGNYQIMIPDPFALAQHALKLEVTGLLPKDCHYSQFWVDRNVEKVDCLRSPMVDCSEHKVSSIINNEMTEYWYQYLYSGIVMNIWGLDTITHSDSDRFCSVTWKHVNEKFVNLEI